MPTDEIRDAFHQTFEPTMNEVTADPTLLAVVRRRHARHQRLSTFGASLGVAAVTASVVLGSMTIHTGDAADGTTATEGAGTAGATEGAGTMSSEPTRELQTVSLVGHEVSLPSDWRLSGNRELIDPDNIQPPEVIGGKSQSVTATSPDGTQQFEATVYSGPIAQIYRDINSPEDLPTFDHLVVNGVTASFHISGPPESCLMVEGQGDEPTRMSPSDAQKVATKRPCPRSVFEHAPYGEVRYTFANGDFMYVDTRGMDADALTNFITTALSN